MKIAVTLQTTPFEESLEINLAVETPLEFVMGILILKFLEIFLILKLVSPFLEFYR